MSDTNKEIESIREALMELGLHKFDKGCRMTRGERDAADHAEEHAIQAREFVVARFRSLLARVEEDAWKPIATAPLDGTHIQLYYPEVQFIGYYAEYACCWCAFAPGLPELPQEPTHWKPLPAPPAALSSKEAA